MKLDERGTINSLRIAGINSILNISVEPDHDGQTPDNIQEQYNYISHADGPLIYSAYQIYVLAAKHVRRAYLVSERKRAQELGLVDSINDSIEANHVSYNAGIVFILGQMNHQQGQVVKEKSESSKVSLKNSSVVLLLPRITRTQSFWHVNACKDLAYRFSQA
ncbi:hypothetical protein BGX21_002543 [Mortierella sp. AD011]|nr:hypothetical protein BGX21_002543 [Mortierella sp. AD011]